LGSIGTGEILLVFLIALLLFGPNKLPELGKALGRAIREFKKAEQEVKSAFTQESGRQDDVSGEKLKQTEPEKTNDPK
jgi:sec-independent protein translocase protein TatA